MTDIWSRLERGDVDIVDRLIYCRDYYESAPQVEKAMDIAAHEIERLRRAIFIARSPIHWEIDRRLRELEGTGVPGAGR